MWSECRGEGEGCSSIGEHLQNDWIPVPHRPAGTGTEPQEREISKRCAGVTNECISPILLPHFEFCKANSDMVLLVQL